MEKLIISIKNTTSFECLVEMSSVLANCFLLRKEFINKGIEEALLLELGKKLKKFRWSEGHFDDKICNYREFSISDLSDYPTLRSLIQSAELKELLLSRPLLPVHVLELRRDGFIRPHIDNHAYSGRLIAGLSLGEEATMTLKRGPEIYTVEIPQRSFYRQIDDLRWNFEHSIDMRKDAQNSRVSLLFRDRPL